MTKKKIILIIGAILLAVIITVALVIFLYNQFFRCKTCGGDGEILCDYPTCVIGEAYRACANCRGTGTELDFDENYDLDYYTCSKCYGRGYDYTKKITCPRCNGNIFISCPDC